MIVVWSRTAIRHLVDLREHIGKGSDQNAKLVASRILKAVDLLHSHPEMSRPGRVLGTRETCSARHALRYPLPCPAWSAGIDCCISRSPEVASKAMRPAYTSRRSFLSRTI